MRLRSSWMKAKKIRRRIRPRARTRPLGFIYFGGMAMNETYTITIFLNGKYMSSVTACDKPKLIDLLNATDNNMKDLGYKRVGTAKVRIGRKRLTNYSLNYTRV